MNYLKIFQDGTTAHLDLITKAEKRFAVEISRHQAMDIKNLHDLKNVIEAGKGN